MKKKLESVTLLGIDCINIERLIQAAEICQKDFEFAEVKLLSSIPSEHPNVIRINEINSIEEYSRFVIAELDTYVDTPHVLLIQYDGFILNPDAWSADFLKYDYIGAPWLVRNVSVNRFGFPKELLGKHMVGNGGFSLRSKKLLSLCAKLSEEGFFQKYHPEDLVICLDNRKYLEEQGIQFAPVPLAQQFSFEAENDQNYRWNDQFGFHGLKWTDISKWLDKNSGYTIDNTLNRDKNKKEAVKNIQRARAIIVKDDKILMIQRLRAGTEYYVLPGGKLEEGESPENTVMREIQEETSLEAKFLRKLDSITDKDGTVHHLYLCEYISGTPQLTANSPEVAEASEGNIYTPMWVEVQAVPSLPMWPAEVKPFLLEYLTS